jgi:aspartate/methionine/tyrosine aminotransferase
MEDRTVTVFSVSKGMALSGYRVGYLAACDTIMDVMYGAAVSVLGAANTSAQFGVLAALKNPEFVRDYTRIFERRRQRIFDILRGTPGIFLDLPESAFLCWIDVSALGTSAEIVEYLIEEAGVYVNDGTAYGEQGRGFIRIVFGCLRDDRRLYDAFEKIAAALAKRYKKYRNQ